MVEVQLVELPVVALVVEFLVVSVVGRLVQEVDRLGELDSVVELGFVKYQKLESKLGPMVFEPVDFEQVV